MPNPRLDTLLMLSGGIDSAYCLWRRVQAGLPTRTHHVILKDHEGRHDVEQKATSDVLAWIRANGGRNLIHHTESYVDFGSVPWIHQNYWQWALWAGTLMSDPRNRGLTKLVLPRHSDAFTGGPDSPSAHKSDRAYQTVVEAMTGRPLELIFPIVGMTKAEVIRAMPKELLDLCWYCRRPQNGRVCGRCVTCQMVSPVKQKLEN